MVRQGGVLLWLAGTVSSTLVTLGSIQKLPASTPLSCVLAYKSRLGECSLSELTGQACSPGCQASVAETQTGIQSMCTMMQLDEEALLSRAQQGALVIVLCGGGRPAPTSAQSATKQSTTTGTVTRSRSGVISFSIISTSTTPSAEISTGAKTTLQKTAPTTSATRISDTLAQTVPSTTTAPSTGNEEEASSSSSVAPQPTVALSPVEAPTSKVQESTPKPGSGGGSPFDFASGSEGKERRVATLSSAVAFAATVLLAQ